jgi:hypothetical protein
VLRAGADRRLRAEMPVEEKPGARRAGVSHLEAVGRTLVGLAPWLELADCAEAIEAAELARATLASGFDPASPDYLDMARGGQPIVDAAFLCHAFLHARSQLWGKLDRTTQDRIVGSLKGLRAFAPGYNNWLLFSAMGEAFLHSVGDTADPMRVDFALRQHDQWYVGGGWYKDGPAFHHDYYNSLVIQPMLLDVAEVFAGRDWIAERLAEWWKRAQRHAEVQERQVSPDGSFPVIGRSIAYRCGAFQHLAFVSLRRRLPASITPGQARRALSSVIHRCLSGPDVFDSAGWLRIGLSGSQPGLGESYISTGSLYLCSAAFLPLGLPATDEFWCGPERKTTWERAWGGEDLPADHD